MTDTQAWKLPAAPLLPWKSGLFSVVRHDTPQPPVASHVSAPYLVIYPPDLGYIWAFERLSSSGIRQNRTGEQHQLKNILLHYITLFFSAMRAHTAWRWSRLQFTDLWEGRANCVMFDRKASWKGGKKRMNSFSLKACCKSELLWVSRQTECVQTEVKETKRNKLEESRVGGGISVG